MGRMALTQRDRPSNARRLVNEETPPAAEHQSTVPLRASHAASIELIWAMDALTDLDWLGPRVAAPGERDDLRRVRTDLELPIFDGSGTGPIRKAALIDISVPRVLSGAVLAEVGWQSASLAPLFPVFAGRLRITEAGLYLDGRYVPPFGRLGLLIDEGILTFVARRTALAFLARLAAHMEA